MNKDRNNKGRFVKGHIVSKKVKKKISKAHKGKKLTEEHRKNISISVSKSMEQVWKNPKYRKTIKKIMRGKNNPNWQGGKSFEPYSPEFNNKLKEFIRERDNHICQKCGITQEEYIKKYNQKLHVHHINDNKKNNKLDNLLTLCIRCHNQIR